MKDTEEKTCQVDHISVFSGADPPPPYIVIIIIRIQCVLVQYITVVIGMLCTAFHIDLTQLNGEPCLICSGSFIFILS